MLLSTPYPPGQLFRNHKKLAPNPTLSESTVSQHEQDVSAWLVIFPSVDKDFGAEQAQVSVLHLGVLGALVWSLGSVGFTVPWMLQPTEVYGFAFPDPVPWSLLPGEEAWVKPSSEPSSLGGGCLSYCFVTSSQFPMPKAFPLPVGTERAGVGS